MNCLWDAIDEIEVQQKKAAEYSPVWCVGEQLKDILRNTPAAAEIVLQDLRAQGMKLTDCEKKIEEFASKHRQGNKGCCPPSEADRIIREFYGIHSTESGGPGGKEAKPKKHIDLADFL